MANVLVVDDNADSCEAVARYLTKTGHSVRCVADGREAMIALGEAMPDFILVDVRMPVMDGVSLAHVIRSYLRCSTIPIAVVTAYAETRASTTWPTWACGASSGRPSSPLTKCSNG